jgi:hypothetical protein
MTAYVATRTLHVVTRMSRLPGNLSTRTLVACALYRYRTAGYLPSRTPVRYRTPVTLVIQYTIRLDICLPGLQKYGYHMPDISLGYQLHGFQNTRIFDFQNPNSSDTGCPDILAARTGCPDTSKGLPRPLPATPDYIKQQKALYFIIYQ